MHDRADDNRREDRMRWCVLVPCLNEAQAIGGILSEALQLGAPVLVVDDGSDDGTAQIVGALPVTLLRHHERRGKGEALRTGFREALARGFDAVVTMDGDGQHSAGDIPRMLAAAQHYPQHIVIAARVKQRQRQPAYRRRANNFADWGIAWACGQQLIDSQSGQRLYPRRALELADTQAQGFVFEADVLITAARGGTRVVAVPIESRYKTEFRGSYFRPLPDFVRIAAHVVGRVLTSGRIVSNYRRMLREPPVLIDPHEADAAAVHPRQAIADS